jgi:hypothetical protein
LPSAGEGNLEVQDVVKKEAIFLILNINVYTSQTYNLFRLSTPHAYFSIWKIMQNSGVIYTRNSLRK